MRAGVLAPEGAVSLAGLEFALIGPLVGPGPDAQRLRALFSMLEHATKARVSVQPSVVGQPSDPEEIGHLRRVRDAATRSMSDAAIAVHAVDPMDFTPLDRARANVLCWASAQRAVGEAELCKLEAADQIWVPTVWHLQTLLAAGVDARRVQLVPTPTTTQTLTAARQPGEAVVVAALDGSALADPEAVLGGFSGAIRSGLRARLELWIEAPRTTDEAQRLDRLGAQLAAAARGAGLAAGALSAVPAPSSPSRIASALAAAHVFVATSRGDGWGTRVFDALAVGTSVIAPALGNYLELFGDLVELVPGRVVPAPIDVADGRVRGRPWLEIDTGAIASSLSRLLADPSHARALGQSARQAVAERQSEATAIAAIEHAISRIDAPTEADALGPRSGRARPRIAIDDSSLSPELRRHVRRARAHCRVDTAGNDERPDLHVRGSTARGATRACGASITVRERGAIDDAVEATATEASEAIVWSLDGAKESTRIPIELADAELGAWFTNEVEAAWRRLEAPCPFVPHVARPSRADTRAHFEWEAEFHRELYHIESEHQHDFEALVESLVPMIRDKSVLDVGCGPADVTLVVKDHVREIVGVDFAAGMVAKARHYCPGVAFHRMDSRRLSFADNAFDHCISGAMLQHIEWGKTTALREMARVARGECFVLTNLGGEDEAGPREEFIDDSFYLAYFDEAWLRRLIAEAGLELTRFERLERGHGLLAFRAG